MGKKTNYHVTKHGDQWAAKKEGAQRAASLHPTQSAAEKAAKDYTKNAGGGEVRVHKPSGPIRDSDTVKPAKDPNPPKDRKH